MVHPALNPRNTNSQSPNCGRSALKPSNSRKALVRIAHDETLNQQPRCNVDWTAAASPAISSVSNSPRLSPGG